MDNIGEQPKENPKLGIWHCSKCKEEMLRDDLTELFGWGLYVCTPCIEAWLNDD